MALTYRDIKTKRLWKSSIGLSEEQFYTLSSMFQEAYELFFNETLEDKIAQSSSEVKFKTYEDLLFFGLYSLKTDLIPIAIGIYIERQLVYAKNKINSLKNNNKRGAFKMVFT